MFNASPLPGTNLLLLGPSGTGKTTSIGTLIEAGITPFCIFTEPGFAILGEIPPEKLHWQYVPPMTVDWTTMLDNAKKINQYSFAALTEVKDLNKSKYTDFFNLLKSLTDFKCDRVGKSFGPVDKWNTDRAIVLDGLSGISIMAMRMVAGGKPVKSPADWGIAQDLLEALLQKLCTDTQAHFVLIAHTEREIDEVAGASRIMASTLGKKLAPKLPRFFNDVVMAVKDGTKFTWSTITPGADLKGYNLPNSDGLSPSLVPIIESWKKRGGRIVPTE